MISDYQKVFLNEIIESFEQALSYIDGVSYDDFLNNREKQDAVIRRLEVAGEACKQISSEVRQDHPAIPWKSMAGMRDWLIHKYFQIDLDIVWKTLMVEIPEVLPKLKQILKQ